VCFALYFVLADPGSRAVYAVGLRPFDCWDHGFELPLRNGFSCFVFVVCCVGSGPATR